MITESAPGGGDNIPNVDVSVPVWAAHAAITESVYLGAEPLVGRSQERFVNADPALLPMYTPRLAEKLQSVNLDPTLKVPKICHIRLCADWRSSDIILAVVVYLKDGLWSIEAHRYSFSPDTDTAAWDSRWLVVGNDDYSAKDLKALFDHLRWALDSNKSVLELDQPIPRYDAEVTSGSVSDPEAVDLHRLAGMFR